MSIDLDIQAVSGLLEASLDPRQSKQAENNLKQQEGKEGFSISLLTIAANGQFNSNTRLAAAVFFKNYVRRNWTDEDGNHKFPEKEVEAIKAELVGIMVDVPPVIQAQIGEAISAIADSDFWLRWSTLVQDLVKRMEPGNAAVNNGVLQVAHSIFKRWEPLYRSDELYTEINHVLENFRAPFLSLWQGTDRVVTENQSNGEALKAHIRTLDLILKLVYDLSTHEMPFEDDLAAISTLLHKYLTYENPLLETDDEDEPGPLEHMRADVFKILVLYTKKYEEDFRAHLVQFVGSSWNMLTAVGPQTKYDLVVSRALEFLTSVASIPEHAQNFNNPDVQGQVTEKVVIPNLSLRDSDVEMFEDEPIEFIRRNLEGSDEDTRRRAATKFLKTLMEQFEKPVTDVVMRYVDHFLVEYSKDRASNWKAKDTAVHLFTSIGAKGQSTAAKGVLSVNPNVDVLDFFQKHVAESLADRNAQPLLKVGAIKYLYDFRSILSQEYWQGAFPLLVEHFESSNYVVYTYATIAVDRALYLTNEHRQPIIPRERIVSLAPKLLQHLFKLMTRDTKPEKVQENEFLMKCVMRVLLVMREEVVSVMDLVLTNLVMVTKVIRHNPSNPVFYYYHFESLGALIRYGGSVQPQKMEAALFPEFVEVLKSNVEEFTPYIFQLLAALVDIQPDGPLSTNFQGLLQPSGILDPEMWKVKGNVPALARLLIAMLTRGAEHIAASGQTDAVLIIFQKLVSTKAYETHGMDLIETIITSFPPSALTNYWARMLHIMFTRLSASKTETFTLRFVRFYHLFSASIDKGLGPDVFIAMADEVQKDVFTHLYITIILPETQKLSRPHDRKTAVISLTRTLADSQAFVDRYSKKGWTITCQALLQLLINPPLPMAADDSMIEDRDVDELGFGAAFTQLNTCKHAPRDPWPEVQDVKKWVGDVLKEADQRHNGRIGQFVDQKLDAQGKAALQQVMSG